MYKNIGAFVEYLESQGELTRVKEFADPSSLIAARSREEALQPDGGKALLFENTGAGYPVLTNVFASSRRMGMIIGADSPQDICRRAEKMREALLQMGQGVKGPLEALSLSRRMSAWTPFFRSGHPACQDSIQNISHLSLIPFTKNTAGSPAVLSPALVNSKHPSGGDRALEANTLYILDECTAGLKIPDHGEISSHLKQCTHRLPLAVCLGGDPLFPLIAAAPKAGGIDPYFLAGFFRGKGVRLTRAFTQDIDIPCESDIVIEGYIQKSEESAEEGLRKLHVTCITHRRDAVLPLMVGGPKSPDKENVRQAVEQIFVEPLRRTVSRTNDLLLLAEEVFYGAH